ncbi:MAG: hypothetical protein GY765_37340 [bacterium]|nr:hypothetical protein [bacterium]
MKFNLFILAVAALFIISLMPGCGKSEIIDYDEVNQVWEQQIVLVDTYFKAVESSDNAEGIIKAMGAFSKNIDTLAPRFNAILEKYAAFKTKIDKEKADEGQLSPELREKEIGIAKMVATLVFTENLANIKMSRYVEDTNVEAAKKKLLDTIKNIKLEASLKNEEICKEHVNKIARGDITGSAKVEGFFKRLRRANISAKFKITMRNMLFVSTGVARYVMEKGKAPEVSELSQLKTYENFVPAYLKVIPLEDAWGNYLYYKADGKNYWLGSAATDSKFNGFQQQGAYEDFTTRNIVLYNGKFIYAPKAAPEKQQAPPAAK